VGKLATFGALPAGGPADNLGKINANDYAVLGKVIRDLNIQVD
jgi:hypothetical protein